VGLRESYEFVVCHLSAPCEQHPVSARRSCPVAVESTPCPFDAADAEKRQAVVKEGGRPGLWRPRS
jgi:hypothetical protein